MAKNEGSSGWGGGLLLIIGGLLIALALPLVGGLAVLAGFVLAILNSISLTKNSGSQNKNSPEGSESRPIEEVIAWLTPEVEVAVVGEMIRISTLTVYSAQSRFYEWQKDLLASSKTGKVHRFDVETSVEDAIHNLALRVLREGDRRGTRPVNEKDYSIARAEALERRRIQEQRKNRPQSSKTQVVKKGPTDSSKSRSSETQKVGTSSGRSDRRNVSPLGFTPGVDEFSVDPSQQGPELSRLMQLLPCRGHWGTEIRPVLAAGGDHLVWHIDEPVRRAAQGQELWSGDQSVLAFLQSIREDGGSLAKLAEVVLTTCKVDGEDKPVPVLELRLRSNDGSSSSVIGRTPLVSNGISYLPGRLQTVDGFRGANDLIARTGFVLLNCDNVGDLGAYWQRLEMRLLAAARVEV